MTLSSARACTCAERDQACCVSAGAVNEICWLMHFIKPTKHVDGTRQCYTLRCCITRSSGPTTQSQTALRNHLKAMHNCNSVRFACRGCMPFWQIYIGLTYWKVIGCIYFQSLQIAEPHNTPCCSKSATVFDTRLKLRLQLTASLRRSWQSTASWHGLRFNCMLSSLACDRTPRQKASWLDCMRADIITCPHATNCPGDLFTAVVST